MRKSKIFFIGINGIVLSSILTGCTPVLTRPDQPKISSARVIDKNYEVGKMLSVYVGNPMIRVKDYVSSTTELSAMQPSENVVMTHSGGTQIKVSKGTSVVVVGTFIKNKQKLTVLQVPSSAVQIIVDESGKLTNSILLIGDLPVGTWKVNTPDAVFTPSISTTVDRSSGYQNYEILYSGINNRAINLTYREYTADDLAKPAFMQNLTYDTDAKIIRFKNYQIELLSATNEKIDFRVLAE